MKIFILLILISFITLAEQEAYQYNAFGIFEKNVQCQVNPLEGGYLVPASATLIKPPVLTQGKIAIFSNNAWNVIDDIRGVYYSISTKEKKIVIDPNMIIPEDYTKEAPSNDEFELWDAENKKWIIDDVAKAQKEAEKIAKENAKTSIQNLKGKVKDLSKEQLSSLIENIIIVMGL